MRQASKIVMVIFGLLAVAYVVLVLPEQAKDDRDWFFDLTEKASIDVKGDTHSFNNIRAFEYDAKGLTRQEWTQNSFNISELSQVWFFLEPFPDSDLVGHTYLSFVFENGKDPPKTLSISVEARKEAEEGYSALKGLFRRFELLYVWSTEKDIHTRIGISLDHTLKAYQLNLTPEQARTIFSHFVERTNDLIETPRFYNTLTANCTNELAKAVNDAYPGALPVRPAWALTGQAPEWLHRHGYVVAPDTPFEAIEKTADIQALVKSYVDLPSDEFSQAWRDVFLLGN